MSVDERMFRTELMLDKLRRCIGPFQSTQQSSQYYGRGVVPLPPEIKVNHVAKWLNWDDGVAKPRLIRCVTHYYYSCVGVRLRVDRSRLTAVRVDGLFAARTPLPIGGISMCNAAYV